MISINILARIIHDIKKVLTPVIPDINNILACIIIHDINKTIVCKT